MTNHSIHSPSAARTKWQTRRREMESTGYRYTRTGVRRKPRLMRLIGKCVGPIASGIGLGRRALANTLALELTELRVFLPQLPQPFEGYRILLLSDLHVGHVPGLIERAAAKVRTASADLAVLTGDIQTWGTPSAVNAVHEVEPLLAASRARDGLVVVLGNHDSHEIVPIMENHGARVLVNEHHLIERNGAVIRLTGIDDVNKFYTASAEDTLRDPSEHLSIALIHSPELADVAADAGYVLYLSGHTHGGQICLPDGRPIFTALDHHRHLATGAWSFAQMIGYTSRGIGVERPVRINCPPEVAVLELRRGAPEIRPA